MPKKKRTQAYAQMLQGAGVTKHTSAATEPPPAQDVTQPVAPSDEELRRRGLGGGGFKKVVQI